VLHLDASRCVLLHLVASRCVFHSVYSCFILRDASVMIPSLMTKIEHRKVMVMTTNENYAA
jgi:hypothetical protein